MNNTSTTELTHTFTRAHGGLDRFDVGDDVRIRGEHGVARITRLFVEHPSACPTIKAELLFGTDRRVVVPVVVLI